MPPVEVSSPPLVEVGVGVGVAVADVAGDAATGVLLLPPSAELVPPQAAARVVNAAIARTMSHGRMNHMVFMMSSLGQTARSPEVEPAASSRAYRPYVQPA
jgi:hypothetical protein